MKIFCNPRERTQTPVCTEVLNKCVASYREQLNVRLIARITFHFQNMIEIELKQIIYL